MTPEMEIAISWLTPRNSQLLFCSDIQTATRYAYNMICLRRMFPLDECISTKALEVFEVLKKVLKKDRKVNESIKKIEYWDKVIQYICNNHPELSLEEELAKIS